VEKLNRMTRFWLGLLFLVLIYSMPMAGFAYIKSLPGLSIVLVAFAVSVFMVYRLTIKNIKLKYPIVNPEGHPDAYSGVVPRPIYEDVQRYPQYFNKKKRQIMKFDNQRKKRKKKR
jgi:hypothetical protein